jgi:rRNA-processing protein FCF1
MTHKVFFDTNIIRNSEGIEHFLGGRDQLERFKNVAEIMIPSIVITEIKNQRRKSFKSKRDSFVASPFFGLMGLDKNRVSDEKIEKWIEKLEQNEKISFTAVPVKDRDILPDIFKLAINNLPPFEAENDKGFKDAIIYFAVLQYAEENPSDQIYFISKDGRLGEAFKGHDRIKVFKDYQEYEKHQKDYFSDSYFLERLQERLAEDHPYQEILDTPFLDPSCIKSIKLDKELNWVLEIEEKGLQFVVEVDYVSKEIISIIDLNF